MEEEGKTVGQDPPVEPYAQQRMIHGPNDGEISQFDAQPPATNNREGVEMFEPVLVQEETRATVYTSPMQRSSARGSVRGLGLGSFPYGDEELDPPTQEEGIEWTPAGIVADSSTGDDGAQKNDEGGSDLTPYNAGWSDTSAGSNPALKELLAEAARTFPTNEDTTREQAVDRSSFSDPFAGALDTELDAGRERAQAFPDSSTVSSSSNSSGAMYRASPTPTSTTSGAVRASPILNEPLPADGKDGVFVAASPKEEESNDGESLLTSEIVREVQKLSRFVKRYEKRRERQSRKQNGKEQVAASIGADVRAAPSLGYDSLSDTASAHKRIPTGAAPAQDFNLSGATRAVGGVFNDEAEVSTDDSSSSSEDESSLFSSESDDATPEASDVSDSSRLGISPFKVQKLLSLSTAPPIQKPEPEKTETLDTEVLDTEALETEVLAIEAPETKPKPPLPERRSYYSYLVNSARFRRASGRGDKWRSGGISPEETDVEDGNTTLSSLRSNEAILDNTDSEVVLGSEVTESGVQDPFSVPSVTENDVQDPFAVPSARSEVEVQDVPGQGNGRAVVLDSTVDASQNIASVSESGAESQGIEKTKSLPAPRVASRNENKGFNKIINLFESKPKDAIFPPNESWQYNY